jgi:hypothetical protein
MISIAVMRIKGRNICTQSSVGNYILELYSAVTDIVIVVPMISKAVITSVTRHALIKSYLNYKQIIFISTMPHNPCSDLEELRALTTKC